MDNINFIEITPDEIREIEEALKTSPDYDLKDSSFSTDSFADSSDITIVQYIAGEEIELKFETDCKDEKFYISDTFNVIRDDILEGHESRDVFMSVYGYFSDVIENPSGDFTEEKESLINFLVMVDDKYSKEDLEIKLNPEKIISDYNSDHDRIYSEDDMTDIQKSLALKELVHMSICQVIDDLELFFTRPFDLTPAEEYEKNKQEAQALEREMQLS